MPRTIPQNLKQALPGLRRILHRFWPALRQERGLIVGSLAALLASVVLRLLEPWPLKFVFDNVIGHGTHFSRHRHRLIDLPFLAGLKPGTLLIVCSVALVLIVALRAWCDFANTVGFAKIGNRVLLRVRNELFGHLQALSLSFHNSARTGDLTIRVIGDVNMLRDAMVTAILPLIANTLVLIGMWAVMFAMQWRLALLAVAALPVLWLWTRRVGGRIRDSARQQRQREGAMASAAAESLGAMKVVQALGLEGLFAGTFLRRSREGQKQDVRTARLSAGLERTVDVLMALTTAGVLYYGARLAMDGAITPGDLLVFLTYLRRAFNPIQDFAKYTGRLAKATAAGERVLDLLDRTPEVRDLPDAMPAPALRGHVRFEGVSFAYEAGCPVLDGIDIEARPGEQVAVVGPSGIGKSTLVSLLLRLYDPHAGAVTIDGQDVRRFTLASLRGQISVVMQDGVLFAASVRENITYGSFACAGSIASEQVEAATKLANAHEFIMALPQAYDTIIGERGVTLSGGQRQRIALARAAVRAAPILVFDEPTTGLDEQNERAVLEALNRLARGRTTFYITHDLRLASRADQILYLESGRVVERGTHEQLMATSTRYAALYALQTAAAAGVGAMGAGAEEGPEESPLWPPDAELARRDTVLPALGLLLDNDALAARLGEVLGRAVESATSNYVRYKPGTSCLVSYRLRVEGGETLAYAKAYRARDAAKMAKAATAFGGVTLGAERAVLWVFPHDDALESLALLGDVAGKRRLLARLSPELDQSGAELRTLAYKPERRYVAQVLHEGQPRAVVKLYASSYYERARRNAKFIGSGRVLRVAERLGRSQVYGALALRWMNGRGLADALETREVSESALARVGSALAELHASPPGKLTPLTRTAEARALGAAAEAVAWLAPALADRARQIARSLTHYLLSLPEGDHLIHGDFHARQVVLQEDAVALLDLDEAVRGDPAWDVGDLLAHLERSMLEGKLAGGPVPRVRESILAGYSAVAAEPDGGAIDHYVAAGLLRLAAHPFRDRSADWPHRMARLIERAEAVLPPGGPSMPTSGGGAVADEVLSRALNPDAVRPHFERLGLRLRGTRLVRHKPGRRCLIEYDVTPRDGSARPYTLIGKVRAKGADERTFRLMQALRERGFGDGSADGISVPEPVAMVPELHLWLQRKVPGVAAATLLAGDQGIALARRLSDAACKLHSADISAGRVHTILDELRILRERLVLLAAARPEWSERLERVIEACECLAATLPPPRVCGIHRDYYSDQVLIAGPRVYLLDLDLYCRGDAALDVGNCLGHMTEQAHRTLGDADALADREAAMLERFAETAGTGGMIAARAYATLTLARLVHISTVLSERRAFTEGLLELCEWRLRIGG